MKTVEQLDAGWNEIFGDGASLDELKQRGIRGKLSDESLRSLYWKKERQGYEDLKKRFAFDPSRAAAKDLGVNNPLSLDEESPWSQYFKDTELLKIIQQDVERTMPDQPFFREDRIQGILTNILFVWSKLNPDVSYRQGMHEILAPILYVVETDKFDVSQGGRKSALQGDVFDDKYVEHDTAVLFYKIMRSAKPYYETGNDFEGRPASKNGKQGKFGESQARTLPIVTHCKKIQNDLLRVLDVELCDHLNKLGIEPQLYGLRWLRLLFGREFALQEVLMLWDGLFADDSSLGLVDWVCVALLIFMRRDLIGADFSSALHRLMKFPPMQSLNTTIPEFISSAKGCRDRYGQIALASAKNIQIVDSDPLIRTATSRQISSTSIASTSSVEKSPSMAEASSDPYAAKVALLESRVATQWREALKIKERDRVLNKKVESSLAIIRDILSCLQNDGTINDSHAPELEGVIDELIAVASELSQREKPNTGWSNQSTKAGEKPSPEPSTMDPLSGSTSPKPPANVDPTSTQISSKPAPVIPRPTPNLQRARSDADRAAAASFLNSASSSASQPARPPILAVPDVDISATVRAATGTVRNFFSEISTAVMAGNQVVGSSGGVKASSGAEGAGYEYSTGQVGGGRRAFPPAPPSGSKSSVLDPLGNGSR
ncbi:TBC1 domain, member 5 [Dinochytrium kinnereticum]|nr:TBC1 domain, member 5 [Dinochytrium kinnereticum]